jgi:hypothetical protein
MAAWKTAHVTEVPAPHSTRIITCANHKGGTGKTGAIRREAELRATVLDSWCARKNRTAAETAYRECRTSTGTTSRTSDL